MDGSVQGMYFGYGNFITAKGAVVFNATHHLNLRFGYQMGTRLSIHGNEDRLAARLTQNGPAAGIEMYW
jgi:hypothetical protein